MFKKTFLALVLSLVLVLAFSVVIASAKDDDGNLKRLTIRNNSENFLSIVLTSQDGSRTYALWTPAGEERIFTIPEGMYDRTTYACNLSESGTLNFFRQTRLVFNSCSGSPPNWGEPSLEKISLEDIPDNKEFQYR
jgi:hypothetical protein